MQEGVVRLLLEVGCLLLTIGIPFLTWNLNQAKSIVELKGDNSVLKTEISWLKNSSLENKGENREFQKQTIEGLEKINGTLLRIQVDLEKKEDRR